MSRPKTELTEQVNVRITPRHKAILEALAFLEARPEPEVLRGAVVAFLEGELTGNARLQRVLDERRANLAERDANVRPLKGRSG